MSKPWRDEVKPEVPIDLCQSYVDKWTVQKATALGHTREAYLLRGELGDGTVVGLKVVADPADAALAKAGFDYLKAHENHGAVPVLASDAQACLMPWIEGPSLLEQMDAGRVDAAFEAQFQTTCRLLEAGADVAGLRPLSDVLAPALAMEPNAGGTESEMVGLAQRLVRRAFKADTPQVALHGDVHVRNILRHGDGHLVIDARGLSGPAAFEFAQSFINPWRLRDQMFGPGGMHGHAARIAAYLGCGVADVLVWALANALYHCHLQFRRGKGRHALNCMKMLLQLLAVEAQKSRPT